MSAATIRAKLEEIALSELGGSFRPHPNRFNIEANDSSRLAAGASVLWGQAGEALILDQYAGVEQDFILTITQRTFVRSDDDKTIDQVDALYLAIDRIIKKAVIDQLDLGTAVNGVRLDSVSEPRPFNDNMRDVIAVTLKFSVRYLIT